MDPISAIKGKIEEHRAVLVNVTDVNDLFLTELVGEEILDESTKEDILDGRKRTEINKRFYEWLCKSDDLAVYETFFLKLRESRQKHIENLLRGATTGDLPLGKDLRRTLQKIMGELTRSIDVDSGLLENLQRIDVISEVDCQKIGAQPTKTDRAKCLWDAVLRGSDGDFEKFKDEIVKTQPELIKLIEQQGGGAVDRPHVDLLKKHSNILARCTDVNLLTIAFLESKHVIDRGMRESLKSTDELIKKTDKVYSLLMSKPKDIFELFLQVMQENEQQHVRNLLMENSSGHQPLSEAVYNRIIEIKPTLIIGMHSGVHLISAIRGYRETADTDFAISQNDYEVLTEKCVTSVEKNSALVDAVLRRSNFSLKSLEEALLETKQDHMVAYLEQGIMFGADIKTTRTDKEEAIVDLFNEKIASKSLLESGSPDDIQLDKHLKMLNNRGIPAIAAQVSNSIMIYTYCKRPCDADAYVQFLNSGDLQATYEKILNILLKIIEQESYLPLEAAVVLKDEDRNIIQKFIDASPTMDSSSSSDKSSCSLFEEDIEHGFPYEFQRERASRSEPDIVLKREKLQADLELISGCRSKSTELMEGVETNQAKFLRGFEESEAAIRMKCEALKDKVENFKLMLLKDQEKSKEHTLGKMAEQIRALESYASVVSDLEERIRQLVQRGTPDEICKSFTLLHERAGKLQTYQQPSSSAIEIFGGFPMVPYPNLQGDSQPVEISEKLVVRQKNFLIEFLDPESGLVEQLIAIRALSEESATAIRGQPLYRDKNKKLLDIIFRDNKCKELLFALVATNQGHLVNYLETEGKYDPKFGQNWLVTGLEMAQLNSMKDKFACVLAPNIIAWFCFVTGIKSWHMNLISSKPSLEEKCDALIEILRRRSISDFYKIVQFLATYPVQTPLKPLEQHREFLGDWLDPHSGLLDAMKPLLPVKEMKSFKHERSIQKRNLKLVDIISSADKYDEFVKALDRTGQRHIANYLNANGVYDPKFAGEWPAAFSTGWNILQSNRKLLVEKLKLHDFANDLVSRGVITARHREALLQIRSNRERNEEFLNMLGRGTIDSYNKAMMFFQASKQFEVAQWLGLPRVPAGFGGFQVQVQVQMQVVNVEKEVTELYSAFGEVLAIHQRGM